MTDTATPELNIKQIEQMYLNEIATETKASVFPKAQETADPIQEITDIFNEQDDLFTTADGQAFKINKFKWAQFPKIIRIIKKNADALETDAAGGVSFNVWGMLAGDEQDLCNDVAELVSLGTIVDASALSDLGFDDVMGLAAKVVAFNANFLIKAVLKAANQMGKIQATP